MTIKDITTRKFFPPKGDLLKFIKESLAKTKIKEESIIVLASKIVSIGDGRCVKIKNRKERDKLIKREADFFIDRAKSPGGMAMLTLKNGILIPTAGIDYDENCNGFNILWPKNSFKSAEKIYKHIKKIKKLKKIGVIVADSHSTPLRRGTVGIALGYYGFNPLRGYGGKKDIFGQKMGKFQSNIADAIASATVLKMGEAGEQTPIAIVENIDFVEFNTARRNNSLAIGIKEDFYAPLLKSDLWKKGGGSGK